MKKHLLLSTLTILFAVPAFSAFPGADINNSNIEGSTISAKATSMQTKKSKHNKKARGNQQSQVHNNQKDDYNDNLRNITQPEVNNINNNLRIPDGETSRLNREMMLNGPQEGFQNNQPRGIGNR